jgi:hypothetical protein
MVLNPYMILELVPAETKSFTCLDLKDAFFHIHVAPQSQPILPSSGKSQYWRKGAANLDLVAASFRKLPHYLRNCLGI